jgi:hypothetical protein
VEHRLLDEYGDLARPRKNGDKSGERAKSITRSDRRRRTADIVVRRCVVVSRRHLHAFFTRLDTRFTPERQSSADPNERSGQPMTIRARLWLGFGLMTAAIIVLATLGLAMLIVVDREYSYLLDVRHQRVAGALRLKTASQAEVLAARSFLLTSDPTFLDSMRHADARQKEVLRELRPLGGDDDATMLDQIEVAAHAYDLASGDDVNTVGRRAGPEQLALGGEDSRRQLAELIDRYVAD